MSANGNKSELGSLERRLDHKSLEQARRQTSEYFSHCRQMGIPPEANRTAIYREALQVQEAERRLRQGR